MSVVALYMVAPVEDEDATASTSTITSTEFSDPTPERMREIALEDALLQDILKRLQRLESIVLDGDE
jgi:hypothetical protein